MNESDLRDVLQRRARMMETPDVSDATINRARRRRRIRGLASAAALVALVAVAVVFLPRGGSRPIPPISPSPTPTRPIVSQPAHVDSIIFGPPSRGAIAGGDVAVDESGVWILQGGVVYRVEPGNNKVVGQTPIGGSGRHAGTGFGSAWIEGAKEIVRINPSPDRVRARIPLSGEVGGITSGFGFVWVTVNSATHGSIIRINPSTNQATVVVRGQPVLGEIGIATRNVIVAGARDGTLYRMDRRSLKFEYLTRVFDGLGPSMSLHVQDFSARVVTGADGGLMVNVHETNGVLSRNTLLRPGPRAYAPGGGNSYPYWIVYDDEVIRMEDRPFVIERLRLGAGLSSIAEGHNALWVANFSRGIIHRITAYPLIAYWD